MKTLLLVGLTVALTAARPASTAFRLRPSACRLTWTGHAEVGSYAPSGTLQLLEGTCRYTGQQLREAHIRVDLRTLHHDNTQLQSHLLGPDFFDVARYPVAEFRLQRVRAGQATGLLTIKDSTQVVTFPFSLSRDAAGQLHLRGTLSLDRTRFGIRYNSRSFFADLGDQAIRNDFQLAFDLLAEPLPATAAN